MRGTGLAVDHFRLNEDLHVLVRPSLARGFGELGKAVWIGDEVAGCRRGVDLQHVFRTASPTPTPHRQHGLTPEDPLRLSHAVRKGTGVPGRCGTGVRRRCAARSREHSDRV